MTDRVRARDQHHSPLPPSLPPSLGYYDVLNYEQHAVSSVIGEIGVFTPSAWETEAFGKDFPEAVPGDSYTLKFDRNKIPGVNQVCKPFFCLSSPSLPPRLPPCLPAWETEAFGKDFSEACAW